MIPRSSVGGGVSGGVSGGVGVDVVLVLVISDGAAVVGGGFGRCGLVTHTA